MEFEKEPIVQLGNKADRVDSLLQEYKGKEFKIIDRTRLDPNVTLAEYELDGLRFRILYDEFAEFTGFGEDIPTQRRDNMGIYFQERLSEEQKKSLKSGIEKIIEIPLIEGETTKKMKETGMR